MACIEVTATLILAWDTFYGETIKNDVQEPLAVRQGFEDPQPTRLYCLTHTRPVKIKY